MICSTKISRAILLFLVVITLAIGSGCEPAAKKKAPDSETPNSEIAEPETANSDASESTTDETDSAGQAAGSDSKVAVAADPEKDATTNKDAAVKIDPPASGARTTISGDLESVDWESMVGQSVTVEGKLMVVDNFELGRRGQVRVARNRLFVPTNRIDPNDADARANSFEGGSNVAKVAKAQKFNDTATITLDDGIAKQNIFPPKLFPELGKSHPSVRVGSTLDGVSGKIVRQRKRIFLVPDGPLRWTPAQRPQRPDVGSAKVTVASFNVLNYFTTIDDGKNRARGADNESEFKRQEAKLVAAILKLDADVIGLMELENNIEAEKRLIVALNEAAGKEVYKGCGLPPGFRETPGGENAIRVGIIYRSDSVTPVGDVSMVVDDAFEVARTPVVQKFKPTTSGNPFTLVVNHFKSKGAARNAAEGDKNKGDGQGAFNATRRSQSLAICDYIDGLKQSEPAARALVIGDLNAYGQEDPIDAMRARGLVDLHHQFEDGLAAGSRQHYSYLYYGQCGSLDHVMATDSLAEDVTGVAVWHINADEPRFLDYNDEFNPPALYQADPFRSSDHDPVLIGIGK